jgi:hypothetical protein
VLQGASDKRERDDTFLPALLRFASTKVQILTEELQVATFHSTKVQILTEELQRASDKSERDDTTKLLVYEASSC